MSLIDFILNLAGLLLWIAWRMVPFDPLTKTRPATLTGTLRRAEPGRIWRWQFLAALFVLLALRGLFYRWFGASLDWTPSLELGTITISFRSDFLWRMMFFSGASFACVLLVFYLWLILFSLVGPRNIEADSCQRFVRIQLGAVHKWPAAFKAILPLLVCMGLWLAVEPLLAAWEIIPRPTSWLHVGEQSIVLGVGAYAVWQYAIGAVLGLHLLNTYVYLGSHPIWNFVKLTAQRLLVPLNRLPLRIGKVDFAPVVEIAVVFVGAEMLQRGLLLLYMKLPF